MNLNVRVRAVAAFVVTVVVLAGCTGWSTPPTGVTSTTAVLHAQVQCAAETADNPCTYWFQYWAEGSSTILSTPKVTNNTSTNGQTVDVSTTVGGLNPDTLYHSQLCGYGDRNVAQPGVCIGQHSSTLSAPGQKPDAGNFSATQRFRTANAGTRATVDVGRPLSTIDTAERPISRDAGFSAAYSSSRSLWVFGDTTQGPGDWFLLGTTAAAGPYTPGQAPTALLELPTPPAAPTPSPAQPALFLPAPQGLVTTEGDEVVPCAKEGERYPAAWTSGMTRIPNTSTLAIVVHEVCVQPERPTWPTERIKIYVYDPATNRFTSTYTPFVASPLEAGVPAEQMIGSPVFGSDGFLYLYGRDFWTSRVFVARVSANRSSWGSAANYRWWDGVDWRSDRTLAVSVGQIAGPILDAHVMDYTGVGSHKLAMIVQTDLEKGEFSLYESPAPTGPWTRTTSGAAPDPCGPGVGCYAFTGHAEPSTASNFMFTWYSPRDRGGRGHMRLGTITW